MEQFIISGLCGVYETEILNIPFTGNLFWGVKFIGDLNHIGCRTNCDSCNKMSSTTAQEEKMLWKPKLPTVDICCVDFH